MYPEELYQLSVENRKQIKIGGQNMANQKSVSVLKS